MQRGVARILPLLALTLGSILSIGPSYAAPQAASQKGALATFDAHGERFRVWVTNPATIAQLKALKAGTGQAHIPNGRILRGAGAARHNAPWRWHLDPSDIQMAEVTTEVCDGMPSYVNQHLQEFVTTVKRYCPWSATLVELRTLSAPPQGAPAPPDGLRIVSVKNDGTSAQHTTVVLRWRDNASAETGFRIRAKMTLRFGGTSSQQWQASRNATRATVDFIAGGINPTRQACFTVWALNSHGQSFPSTEACATL